MKKRILWIAFVLIFALSIVYFLTNPQILSRKQVAISYDLPNFHIVSANVLRGAQPTQEGFRKLKENYKVKTILNLRNEPEQIRWEKGMVEKLGMNFINISMVGYQKQSKEKIDKILSIIANKINQPIFVHCQYGKDRAGLILAAYRIKYDNWSFDEALLEMLGYGYDRLCCFRLEESLMEWNKEREKGK